ncbi:MAG: transketolase C-terminal domain-containing protein [Thermoplasmata archaeon]
MKKVMTGNEAQAWGAKLSRTQVVAAYPITPQTVIVETISDFIARGEMEAKYLTVESEHSAMQACISASLAGARAYTATSSQGLLLMHELLHWAAGQRTPVAMGVVNRAVGPPWNIWVDHTDSMAQRDTNWIQIYAENNQEVLDMVIQGYRLGEDPDVSLPVMIMEDAFYLSHTAEPVDIPSQAQADDFLPPFQPRHALDVDEPMGFNVLAGPDLYEEFRFQLAEAMETASNRVEEVDEAFGRTFERRWGGLTEWYRCGDADVVLLALGTAVSTSRMVVDELRESGIRAGLAKLRFFRPFPREQIRQLAQETGILAVLDRSYTGTYGGPLYTEVSAAVQGLPTAPLIRGFYGGIGGRSLTPEAIRGCFEAALRAEESGVAWADLKPFEKVVS